MLRPLDLFPFEAPATERIPIQGRIILRNHPFRLELRDIAQFIEQGIIKATDDPDQAQDLAANGFR
jgi:hypothetical protein